MMQATNDSVRETGTVKWFNNSKGYGFIAHPTQGDVFVYYQDIMGEGFKTLRPLQHVEFTLLDRGRGPAATAVMAYDTCQ